MRGRNVSLTPWGGGPEPADHEFIRRLFRRWDTEGQKALTLQNLVTGFAQVKGTHDIMANIAYFFDLYDDDQDGKVDRESILKMSEAFLFLGRKGLDIPTLHSPAPKQPGGDMHASKDEQFLSAVSSFIKRAFEYADPDGLANMEVRRRDPEAEEASKAMEAFAIGDSDEEEDLVDLGGSKTPSKSRSRANTLDPKKEVLNLPPVPSEDKPHTHAANLALDPAHPLFISLPTFRMVILADEILESFFDCGFSHTFHLADAPIAPALSLTTFTNLGRTAALATGAATSATAGVILPPSKGLRGMLDNIVSDGMRMAGEVRRRMEEAQREVERASGPREDDDEEEKGEGDGKSVLSNDMDLLEDAVAEGVKREKGEEVVEGSKQ